MNREEALDIVKSAREDNKLPDLRDTDLRGADLSYANLYGADLHYADLRDADLHGADLRDADLRYADLRDADLYYADLHYANLRDANLYGANLRDADLHYADLHGADLRYTDLRGADLHDVSLHGTRWGGLEINHLPSGTLHLTPTPEGWHITLGCWDGTPDQLRNLIAQNQGWPEAKGDEITRRRPYIHAALALCDIHMQDHEDIIPRLAEKWTNKENHQ